MRPSSQGFKPASILQRLKTQKKKEQSSHYSHPSSSSLLFRLIQDGLLKPRRLSPKEKLFKSGSNGGITLLQSSQAIRCFSTASSSSSFSEQDELRIKNWQTPVIESKGDYRDEAFLEEYIGGSLYENQSSLPRLPIPTVAETMTKLLPTALPLAKTPAEAAALKSACEAFPKEAEKLQERLIERRDKEMKDSSWLQPWWNQLGYLQVRDSVVGNVSYWFAFVDDETIRSSSSSSATNVPPPNIQRASAMLYATAEFRKAVVTGTLPAETLGRQKIPLDATSYRYMFNACRIPNRVQDSYRIYDPSRHVHAVVARKGQFFAMDFVDEAGNPLPMDVLQDQLVQCVEMADALDGRPKLGILTSTNRDNWADDRDKLLAVGGKTMKRALDVLESGAVLVNLDDSEPSSLDECAEMLLTGGSTSGSNRWFDKSMQLIIANNGKAGALNEHSMMDGMPVTAYADYITKATYVETKNKSESLGLSNQTTSYKARDIFAEAFDQMGASVLTAMEERGKEESMPSILVVSSLFSDPLLTICCHFSLLLAREEFNTNIDKQSSTALAFDGYGSNFIKSVGHAPDAFVQVAMQLATCRLFGEQCGTYEATQVRRFKHGRTEVTRAVTAESAAFLSKMGLEVAMAEDSVEDLNEKQSLLKEATVAHQTFSRQASEANGVDRHLFGLSMMVGHGEEKPTLYNDPVFSKAQRWRVSTSNLSHPKICNWGFGQVVPDGVGIGYSIHPDHLVFNIAALKETGWSQRLATLLRESLTEMQLVAKSKDNGLPKSKL